ncbi:MAG: radical SAM protein [Clostridium sp.]|uniref:radical SAM/SPASM domain-containing protein n=1 Tax=Clostridium sp. TaxID=1506 RepID=UPI00305CCAC8
MIADVNFLVLWMTNDCNLKCRYCYANGGEKKEYMDFETAKRALEIPKNKFKLEIAGGEPLLNFQLIRDIHKYLVENKPEIKIQMQTNGALINRAMAKEIKEMNIAVGISLDGPIEINEVLRGDTLKVINGIKALAYEGVMVNLNCVVTDENIRHLEKLVDLAFYLGNIGGIGLDLLRNTGRAINNVKRANKDDISKYVRKAYERSIELSKLNGRRIFIREIEDARKRMKEGKQCLYYCHAANGGAMVVLPKGQMYPCGSLINMNQYYMGNIYDEKTSQKNIKIHMNKPNSCGICKYGDICTGACPSRSILNGYDTGVTIEDCALRKVAFNIVEDELIETT